jgi:hypothetical protein
MMDGRDLLRVRREYLLLGLLSNCARCFYTFVNLVSDRQKYIHPQNPTRTTFEHQVANLCQADDKKEGATMMMTMRMMRLASPRSSSETLILSST